MRRRDFIKAIVGAVTGWPFAACGQQTDGKRRVSILLPYVETDAEVQTWIAAFVQALRELGWIDGSNIQIDTHWTGADDRRINQLAMEVIDRKSHVILANGPLAVASLKQITSTIPIVFIGITDPVGSGLVADLARPDGNITGFTLGEFNMSGKMPEILTNRSAGHSPHCHLQSTASTAGWTACRRSDGGTDTRPESERS